MRNGPLLMTLASVSFTVMVALVQVAQKELSTLEIMWWRAAVSVPLGLLFLPRAAVGFRLARPGLFLARTVLGFGAMFCFFTAATGDSITTVVLLGKMQPIFIALLAPLLLGTGERAGGSVVTALAIGMAGCVLIVVPQGELAGLGWETWALGGALLSAFAHLSLRRLGNTDSPFVLVFWFQVVITVLATVGIWVTEGRLLPRAPGALLPALLGIGVTAVLGQTLMTWAYKLDRAALIAAATYTSPLWALCVDLVNGERPGWVVFAGGGLVVAAGLRVLWLGATSGPPRRPRRDDQESANNPETLRYQGGIGSAEPPSGPESTDAGPCLVEASPRP